MYVCICNAITDKQIRRAAKAGATNLRDLQSKLGVAAGCGSCEEAASEILAEYRIPVGARLAGERRRQLAGEPQVYQPAVA